MKKMMFLMLTLLIWSAASMNAQVTIGSDSNPDASAVLDLQSTDKGLLIPRVSLSALNSAAPLTGKVAGMVVYNTGTGVLKETGLYYNDGTNWVKIQGGAIANAIMDTITGGGLNVTGKGTADYKVGIKAKGVTTAMLQDSAVTTAKIKNLNVTKAKIADNAIDSFKLASNAVTTAKILNRAVTNAKIADATITYAKIATALKDTGKILTVTEDGARWINLTPTAVTTGQTLNPRLSKPVNWVLVLDTIIHTNIPVNTRNVYSLTKSVSSTFCTTANTLYYVNTNGGTMSVHNLGSTRSDQDTHIWCYQPL